MKSLFVIWQDPDTRQWIPVGRLTRNDAKFQFAYTKGAKESKRFVAFGGMPNFDAVYESPELFPQIANRILPKSRPEYSQYLSWLGLDSGVRDDLEVLARSGGLRATDSLEVVPCPEPSADRELTIHFFARGLRHLSEKDQLRVFALQPGEPLYLMKDVQNKVDSMALLMRTGDPISVVGYCPRYFSADFSQLLTQTPPDQVSVVVDRVSKDAPSQFRLLCRLRSMWPHDFAPCSRGAFELLSPSSVAACSPS
jgi:hypothetical protein